MNVDNYVITIGRQLGSGGGELGKKLAEHFGFPYVDKQVLVKASEQLDVKEENLAKIEEKSLSFLGSMVKSSFIETPFIPVGFYLPTGRQLFDVQSRILKTFAEDSSCVITGRCGSFLFRNHPRHINIFVRSTTQYQVARLMKTRNITEEEALKSIDKIDKERSKYYNTYTGGQKWTDAQQYDLCINSSAITMDQMVALAIDYINARFPELKTVK